MRTTSRKYLSVIMFLMIILSSINSNSQVIQQWVQRYNGPGNSLDEGFSVASDAAGNIYVTGTSLFSSGSVYLDYTTIKYNPFGVQQWVQRFNGAANSDDIAQAIAIDPQGNIYVTGQSWGGSSRFDYVTVKYNPEGVQQWVQTYNGPANRDDAAICIAVDPSGSVYIAGYSFAGTATAYDFAVIKYSSGGAQQWVKRYNGDGNGDDNASSIATDSAGNVYTAGYSYGNGTAYDFALVKYSPTGVQLWAQRYNGQANTNDYAKSISLDNEGNVYITGNCTGITSSFDYATIKYNSAGNQQWVRIYNGPGNNADIAWSVSTDDMNNIYVTGSSKSGTAYGTNDFATVKYNSSGTQQWVQRYNGPGNHNDDAYSIVTDALGNVYISGNSRGSGTGIDYAVIKYNTSGVEQWVQRYNGPGNDDDQPKSLIIDNAGNVIVTGRSIGAGSSDDYATIKYSQTIGIHTISNNTPEQFSLSQNYPNPFNPTTNFEFQVADFGLVNLTIYDVMGREVETLVNEQLKPGTYEVNWDASNFVSGVYFYRLRSGEFTETRKMILIK